MTRLQAFLDRIKNHLLYRRLAKKLTEDEVSVIMKFIEDNYDLDFVDFERKATRLYIDGPKPKHANIMVELILVANIAANSTLNLSQ